MFVLIGFLLISIGTTITFLYNDFSFFMEDHFFSPAALLVAIGIIIFFVSLIGCVGAVKGSTCLVNIYGLFLILLLILEVAAAIAAYSMRGNIGDYIHEAMKDSMDKYDENHYVVEAWDGLQCRMQCCGIDGSSDWDNRNITVPETCFSSSGVEFDFGCHYRLMNLISESAPCRHSCYLRGNCSGSWNRVCIYVGQIYSSNQNCRREETTRKSSPSL